MRKNKHLLSVLALSVFAVFAVASGSGDKSQPDAANEKQEATSTPDKPKEWKEVFSLKGSGAKKTAPFKLNGGKAKVEYKCQAGLFSFYVVPVGEDVMETGGFPEVMTQEKEESEAYITKSAGEYYLNMNATGKWEVIIKEEM